MQKLKICGIEKCYLQFIPLFEAWPETHWQNLPLNPTEQLQLNSELEAIPPFMHWIFSHEIPEMNLCLQTQIPASFFAPNDPQLKFMFLKKFSSKIMHSKNIVNKSDNACKKFSPQELENFPTWKIRTRMFSLVSVHFRWSKYKSVYFSPFRCWRIKSIQFLRKHYLNKRIIKIGEYEYNWV